MSDAVQFDFGNSYESYILYNNLSIAGLINTGNTMVFDACTQVLNKKKNKEVRAKFSFLLKHRMTCLPVDQQDIELGYNLLDAFVKNIA
ncbi:hypothetical protein [Pedobacter aquatilis]|uniref:hypothetical protein n=1 Tax=Pedobacter aquatilis TaxID=351343 RepID=UPI00292DCFCB|nr:hypothetical protein [Pedobacter aquatilis]